MIPTTLKPLIFRAINDLVREYGHPDFIPVDEMTARGIPEEFALLLVAEELPVDAAAATAQWLHLIAGHFKRIHPDSNSTTPLDDESFSHRPRFALPQAAHSQAGFSCPQTSRQTTVSST